MNQRQAILERLRKTLLNINRENGYKVTIAKVIPVLRTIEDNSALPAVIVIPSEENIQPVYEAGSMFQSAFDINMLIHIESEYDIESAALWESEAEKWIEAVQWFLAGSDLISAGEVKLIPGVENIYLSRIEPYTDWRDNKQTLKLTITVNYILQTDLRI